MMFDNIPLVYHSYSLLIIPHHFLLIILLYHPVIIHFHCYPYLYPIIKKPTEYSFSNIIAYGLQSKCDNLKALYGILYTLGTIV